MMRKAIGFLIVAVVVVAVSSNWAGAIPAFNTEFKGKYYKPNGTDVEKEFAKKVDMAKCLVCHDKKDGKEDKKLRNAYGKALDELLDKKKDVKDKEKIKKALDTVYDQKVPGTDETFGDRIKAGNLPGGEADKKAKNDKGGAKVPAALDFEMTSIDGKKVELSKYKGKVVLMVNVASQCGLTPQYEALEGLHDKYAERGLAVLGFPANEFGKQEPGSDEEIADFCKSKFDVKFDMFSKVVVKGDGQCPLYKFLTSKETDPKFAGDITWNFEKFLVNRDGEVVARFAPKVKPDSEEVVKAIEAELEK